jgi:Tol biopolymer transport system component
VGDGLWIVRPDGTGRRRIRREGNPGGASWSPDGKRIAFDCVLIRRFESCTVGVDGSGLRGLSRAGRHPNWSSRNLIAVTLEEPSNGVLIVTPGGRLVRHLRGALSSPTWSPDASRLVMASEVAGNTRLYATDPSGKSSDRLTAQHGTLDRAPIWSPDGTRIVFRRHRPGRCSLIVLDPRTQRTRVLVPRTTDRYCDDRPDWARGRGILYESAGDLWVVSPRGGRPRRITSTRVAETFPRWGPRGEIGFLAPGGIWARRADGSRSLLVPDGGLFAWSHDGRSLVYTVYNSATDENDLYLKVGSNAPRKLFAGIDGAPSWSPDNRRLVFSHTDADPGGTTELLVVSLGGNAHAIWGEPLGDPDWRPR